MASGPRIPFSGILLIVFGGLFLADQMGVISFGQTFAQWWPALLILAGILQLVEHQGGAFLPITFITVGTALLLSNLGYLQIGSVWRLWPLALIALGLKSVLGSGKSRA